MCQAADVLDIMPLANVDHLYSSVVLVIFLQILPNDDDYHSGPMPSADGCYVKYWLSMCMISTHDPSYSSVAVVIMRKGDIRKIKKNTV